LGRWWRVRAAVRAAKCSEVVAMVVAVRAVEVRVVAMRAVEVRLVAMAAMMSVVVVRALDMVVEGSAVAATAAARVAVEILESWEATAIE
jgi:hypothetical protein